MGSNPGEGLDLPEEQHEERAMLECLDRAVDYVMELGEAPSIEATKEHQAAMLAKALLYR